MSVVIPAHEGRHLVVRRAALSALAEERPHIAVEVIVVDDGSSGTEIADAVAGLGVSYVRREVNGGAAAARQTGIGAASGTWLVLLDSDDEFVPGRLEMQLTEAGAADVVGGLARGDLESRSSQIIPDYLATRSLDEMIDTPYGACTHQYLIRTSLAKTVGFDPNARGFEDWDFLYRLRLENPRIVTLPEVMTEMHGDSTLRVSTATAANAAGLAYFYEKHRTEITRTRQRAGDWAFIVAMLHRRCGDMPAFRTWALRSLRQQPLRPRRALSVLSSFRPSARTS